MRYQWRVLRSALFVGGLMVAGCAEPSEPPAVEIPASGQLPADHPDIGQAPAQMAGGGPAGVVLETMESGGYTYALLDIEGDEIWAAGPPTELAIGDEVALVGAVGMQNFTSSTLDRTFEQILFVNGFTAPGAGPETFAGNSGLVKETMDAAGYTYALVEIEGQTMWLAGPQTALEVGQTVGWMGGSLMRDFPSGSLGRTFDAIMFVDGLQVIN